MANSNEIKLNNRTQYCLFQTIGWGLFVVIVGFLNSNDGGSRVNLVLFLGLVFEPLGMSKTNSILNYFLKLILEVNINLMDSRTHRESDDTTINKLSM